MANWIDLYFQKEQNINWISDRIQPFMEIKINEDWLSYPLGIFLLSSPSKVEQGYGVDREVEAFDELIILNEDKFDQRYTVKAGERYDQAVIEILKSANITKYNIEDTTKTLSSDMEWSIGTEKIRAVNDLLASVNFTPIWVDEHGYFTSSKYANPEDRSPIYDYMDNEVSITFNGMTEKVDYLIPNKWVVVYSNPDNVDESSEEPVLYAVYENRKVDDPNSIVNTYTKVDYREVDDIADQEALDEYVQRIAANASQVYGKVKFETALMPGHSYHDVLFIRNNTLEIEGKYSETAWEMTLEPGGTMSHEVRKVVDLY
ncbi:hypothetical protein [Halobacillus sp. H74]|uniref:hypothetical protein n=1 Tax=Halobacillus sp. H74 TaxID=3457436 RepID=UPI003FCE9EEC